MIGWVGVVVEGDGPRLDTRDSKRPEGGNPERPARAGGVASTFTAHDGPVDPLPGPQDSPMPPAPILGDQVIAGDFRDEHLSDDEARSRGGVSSVLEWYRLVERESMETTSVLG